VNELLCYVYNRIDTLPNEELVNIVSRFYDDAEINSALVIIKECINRFLPSGHRRRLPKRIGKDKKVKSVEDICILMHDFSVASVDTAATSLPSFVAYKLSRLPAVDSSHLDVTTLSQQVLDLHKQVKDMTTITEMKDELKNLLSDSVKALNQQFCAESASSDLHMSELKNSLSETRQKLHDLKSQMNSISSRVLYATSYQAMKSGQDSTNLTMNSGADDNQSEPTVTAGSLLVPTVSANLSLANVAADTATVGINHTAVDQCLIIPAHDHQADQATTTDGDGFQTVQRSSKRKKPVVGRKAVPSSLRSLQPIRQPRSLFVTRLPPDATAEDLTEFVAQVFKLDASCTKIVSGQYHSSFKVSVCTTQPKLLYDNSRWPEGALVRHYYEPRERHDS